MRFSLIIPAHDAEDTLAATLDSVARQTFTDLEVLVVADRCSDATPTIVERFGWHPVLADVGHPGLARNVGMDAACGEYLLFLDADDTYVCVEALELIDAALTAEADPDILHFSFFWGTRLTAPIADRGRCHGMVWSRAWRREFVGGTRFEALEFAEDEAFCMTLFDNGARHATLGTPLIAYTYPRTGSLTWAWFRQGRTA